MKPSNRRIRRRSAAHEAGSPQKENQQERKFFGPESHEPFFQPAAVQRAADPKPEEKKEEEKINRAPQEEKKEEKLAKAPADEKKEEEKLAKAPEEEKKEEKLAKAPEEEKKEEKVSKAPAEKEEEKKVSKKGEAGEAGESTIRYVQSLGSKGKPLPEGEQEFYGERIGHDFSAVRIHTGADAEESARDVSAKAYTYGNHIVFNEGQYDTGSHHGRHLLAHELTHVVQQGGGGPAGKSGASADGKAAGVGQASRMVQRGVLGWLEDRASDVGGALWGGAKWTVGKGLDVLQSAGAWVWDFATWMPSRVWSVLRHVGSGIVGTVTWLWRGISGALGHVWDGLKGLFSWIGDGVEGLFGWIWRGLRGAGNWAWRLLNGDFSAFWDGFADAFSWLASGAGQLMEWGWQGLEGLAIWGWKGLQGLGGWIWEGLRRGLPWIGRLLAKLLDILGVGEMWTFLMNILKFYSTRTMSGAEIAEARKVYAGSIAYWQVRIDEMSLIASIGAWIQGSSGMGVTTGHTINFNRALSAAAGNPDMAWLIHELGHVAQYTAVGLQYMGEAVYAQVAGAGYNYGGGSALAGKNLGDFNREQQADILSDYYTEVLYGTSPYAAEYTRLRDQAVRGAF